MAAFSRPCRSTTFRPRRQFSLTPTRQISISALKISQQDVARRMKAQRRRDQKQQRRARVERDAREISVARKILLRVVPAHPQPIIHRLQHQLQILAGLQFDHRQTPARASRPADPSRRDRRRKTRAPARKEIADRDARPRARDRRPPAISSQRSGWARYSGCFVSRRHRANDACPAPRSAARSSGWRSGVSGCAGRRGRRTCRRGASARKAIRETAARLRAFRESPRLRSAPGARRRMRSIAGRACARIASISRRGASQVSRLPASRGSTRRARQLSTLYS